MCPKTAQEEFTGLKYKEINVDDDDKAILLSGDDDNKSNESDGEREYDTDGKPIIIKRGKPTQPKPASKRGKGAHRRYEIGGRIYDSVNGTSCHQCRQKTMDPKVTCTNLIVYRNADGSETRAPCPLMMDDQCLMGRYGEKVAEMAARGDWVCPKCRGICNCSFCMAKRGKQPTGQLKMQALQLGYKSVSDMLAKTGALVPKKRTRKEAKQEAKGNTVNAVEDIAAAAAELDDIAKKDAVDGNLEEVDGNTTENEESKCQDFSG
ncbi:zinc-finger domain of monoamine-oxidase A repressor R1-domain-containing protein [Chytriomyces sp. MP71]|nr:zinc-finger domain of monoamine-oxidase A repressor R1-domain-containing protein [Chytriomyces sp. MP71]